MIRRVYANQHGIITLDSDKFGVRKRISTGKKSDKRLLAWYEKNFDSEFERLYNEKFYVKKEDYSNFTLREYGEMVLELTKGNRRSYVHEANIRYFKRICDFKMSTGNAFGDMMLQDIKTTHIMLWQNKCGLSPQSVASRRTYLNIVLQTAMNDDIIRKNPVPLVKLPKRTTVKSKVFYSEDEIKNIINTAKGQLKNYIQLACFTGMRGSELIGLKWDDIDFDKETIRVDSGIVKGIEDRTKSGSIRMIPMFKQAKESLLRQRQFSGLREYVFLGKFGGHYYSSAAMNHAFKLHLKENNIRKGTVHDLRRSFNTILKQHGYPNDFILDIIGHMGDRVNRNHYTGSIAVDMSKIDNIAL